MIDQRDAHLLDQIGALAGALEYALDDPITDSQHSGNRSLDQIARLLVVERENLDLLEEVVPGAAHPLPVLLDLDSRDHGHQAFGKALHEQAAQPLVDSWVVVVELIDFVDQQDELHLLAAGGVQLAHHTPQIPNQVSIGVGDALVLEARCIGHIDPVGKLMKHVLGDGGEEPLLRCALKIHIDRIEVVNRIVQLEQPPFEMMLNRSLTDSPLAKEQQAVVVDRLQNAIDELVSTHEQFVV